MELQFSKYHGAGNDFVLIDNRTQFFDADNVDLINWLCDRRFGIGADGLMLLENHDSYDFEMRYFNADGKEASMCGNGGRCIVAFAAYLKIIEKETCFLAVDGEHHAVYENGIVDLQMIDINHHQKLSNAFFMDTGSPHYVEFVNDISKVDVVNQGRAIRESEQFAPEGTNVNFVQKNNNQLTVYTFERGVEDETLACGTGITASALCASLKDNDSINHYQVKAKGGDLEVRFNRTDNNFTNVWLKGPAARVFDGKLEL